jgi:radical SAM protein with 4Fe4S-binding SPASM domain
MSLSGLFQINVELSSRCDKATLCGFCSHQSSPSLRYGDMDFELLKLIRSQLEPPMTVQFHRDGDPLIYPRLADALDLFDGFIRSIVTHGETLAKRADEIIGRSEVVTVSVFRGDKDVEIQWESLIAFLEKKGLQLPRTVIKIVGDMDSPNRYEQLGVTVIRRLLHNDVNTKYVHRQPVRPEQDICLDFLGKPAISWDGKVFQCVRFDETEDGYLGDLRDESLESIWNGPLRKQWMQHHIMGQRDLANARCAKCTYYGVPSA